MGNVPAAVAEAKRSLAGATAAQPATKCPPLTVIPTPATNKANASVCSNTIMMLPVISIKGILCFFLGGQYGHYPPAFSHVVIRLPQSRHSRRRMIRPPQYGRV